MRDQFLTPQSTKKLYQQSELITHPNSENENRKSQKTKLRGHKPSNFPPPNPQQQRPQGRGKSILKKQESKGVKGRKGIVIRGSVRTALRTQLSKCLRAVL